MLTRYAVVSVVCLSWVLTLAACSARRDESGHPDKADLPVSGGELVPEGRVSPQASAGKRPGSGPSPHFSELIEETAALPEWAHRRRYADVSVTDHDGPVLVLYTELIGPGGLCQGARPAGRAGNELVGWHLRADGSPHSAESLVAGEWTTFEDTVPQVGLTSAPFVWIGTQGFVVWDEPIRWWLGAATLADSKARTSATPTTPTGGDAAPVWDPDLCRAGDRLLLVCVQGFGNGVIAAMSPALAPEDWGPFGPTPLKGHEACRPSVTASAEGHAYLACTLVSGGPESAGRPPLPGSMALCDSTDGVTWSEPKPTVDEPKAHSSALAADDDIGLVLVYTAEREDGWPVFAARSADFGETWGEPVMLTEPTVHAFRPDAMIHDGVLYVAYLVLPDDPARDDDMGMLKDPVGVMALTLDPMELPVP